MKKILVFGGSNSKKSINKQLAVYASTQVKGVETSIIDLNDFPLPIYGIDLEEESGIPENVIKFYDLIDSTDAVVLSLAEHNGSYTTAFKNVLDWLSRHEAKTFGDKPMLLLSTSPGGRAGIGVMEAALSRLPRQGANVVGNYSLPSFFDNFKDGVLLNDIPEFNEAIASFQKVL
ncbi:MAG: chromate reductase [Parvicellaceae bacterium]|jgi:chromate reductase